MSSTRKQNTTTPEFRQDAFSSSTEFHRGVLANLVAARLRMLSDPDVISVLLWVQQVSWREGGLNAFAAAFLERHPHLLGTRSMHRFGCAPGQIYTRDQVIAVRREIARITGGRDDFPLRNEIRVCETYAVQVDSWQLGESAAARERAELEARAASRPDSYPAAAFLEHCAIEPDELADELKRFLLDPKTDPAAGLWNMPGLFDSLRKLRDEEAKAAEARIVETEVTKTVAEELDFVLEQGAFVVVEGREGIGKSEAARNWCERHPGRAVYVKLVSGGDDTTFFRNIAKQLGTTHSLKTNEVRARIEDTLQAGGVVIVFDEAHFLWPQSARSERTEPRRMEWVRSALVDFNVGVALISTPQHFETQCARFRKAGWNINQTNRRVANIRPLPEELKVADVKAVAARYFPELDNARLKRLAAAALGTIGYLGTIGHIRKRVDFYLGRQAGATESEMVDRVLAEKGIVVPEISSTQARDGHNPEAAAGHVTPPLNRTLDRSKTVPRGTRGQAPVSAGNGASLTV